MSEEAYRQVGEAMVRRGAQQRSLDLPEYYEMLEVLFTPEEAEVQSAMPDGSFTPDVIARETGRSEEEVTAILEAMADKGLCGSSLREGTRRYFGMPLLPGLIEFQFMRGTTTERDRRIARATRDYRMALEGESTTPRRVTYPGTRVIPVNSKVQAGAAVKTHDQLLAYLENLDPIAAATCFCRQEALLLDENDVCGMPLNVCFTFGRTAQSLIERGIARQLTTEEASGIMEKAEEAGLVHFSSNTQEIGFICNCCACHCGILDGVLKQPKPAEAVFHAFEPSWDAGLCTLCGTCVDRCPTDALVLGSGLTPDWDGDRCIGCGVCASGCAEGTITLVERAWVSAPPVDRKALGEEVAKSRAQAGST
jgi:Pyruvate/2-oxoacid:ferredoxin oxidoreductase delta subunit